MPKKQKHIKKLTGYAYVVADIFHLGHLKHLQRCKRYCDVLYVGVLTNEATMEKKPHPIMDFKERLEIISNIKCVDYGVEQDEYSPIKNFQKIGADILFESTSHTKEAIDEAKRVGKEMGKDVMVLPYYPQQSSTSIKNKIKKIYEVKN